MCGVEFKRRRLIGMQRASALLLPAVSQVYALNSQIRCAALRPSCPGFRDAFRRRVVGDASLSVTSPVMEITVQAAGPMFTKVLTCDRSVC